MRTSQNLSESPLLGGQAMECGESVSIRTPGGRGLSLSYCHCTGGFLVKGRGLPQSSTQSPWGLSKHDTPGSLSAQSQCLTLDIGTPSFESSWRDSWLPVAEAPAQLLDHALRV
jgi:hypothetical protein